MKSKAKKTNNGFNVTKKGKEEFYKPNESHEINVTMDELDEMSDKVCEFMVETVLKGRKCIAIEDINTVHALGCYTHDKIHKIAESLVQDILNENRKENNEEEAESTELPVKEITITMDEVKEIATNACTLIMKSIMKDRQEVYKTDINAFRVIGDFIKEKINKIADLSELAIDSMPEN